jgi:hypothetical protein
MSSDKKAEFGPKFGVGTPLYRHHTTSLVFNDPPLHTRVRKLLAAAFTPRALANLQPRIEAVVDGLLAQHADRGRMDLVEDFAFRLPVEVICDMLGVPAGERAPFRRYSLAILARWSRSPGPSGRLAGNAAVAEFSAYLDQLVAERARRPADERDILGTLIHGEVDGERLSHDELVQNCIFLLNAGHETTTNLIGNTVDALLRFPTSSRGLKAEPGLSRAAIEEGCVSRAPTSSATAGSPGRSRSAASGWLAGTYIHHRHRRRQSRSGAVSRARPLRRRPRAQPALRLRLGRAYVPGRGAGPPRGHHRDRPAGRAVDGGCAATARLRAWRAGARFRGSTATVRSYADPWRPDQMQTPGLPGVCEITEEALSALPAAPAARPTGRILALGGEYRARTNSITPSGRHRRSGSPPSGRAGSRRCAWRSAGRAW